MRSEQDTRRMPPRARRRLVRSLAALALLATVLPLTLAAATADADASVADGPSAAEIHGLHYEGLTVNAASRCGANLFALEMDGRTLCTHGPDAAPDGIDVRHSVNLRGMASAAAAASVPCYGDGVGGERVQIVYAGVEGGTNDPDGFAAYADAFAAGIDEVFSASAAETGGVRHVRFVTDSDCSVNVQNVVLSAAGAGSNFWTTISELESKGLSSNSRKYLVFADTNVLCGIGTQYNDDRPGGENYNNVFGGVSRIDRGCWYSTVAAHELTHNFGGVQDSAPHSTQAGHCFDEYDVMCYADGGAFSMQEICLGSTADDLLDCNHDDYFHTNPPAGNYLATHWNSANSAWLTETTPTEGGGDPSLAPGMYVVTDAGAVHALNGAVDHGRVSGGSPVVAGAATASGSGYWLVQANGAVTVFGDAQHFGDASALPLNGGIRAMAVTKSGNGYWLMGDDGGIFSYGDAAFHGSMGGVPLNGRILDMAATEDGYWLVGEDGGVFSFDVGFHGSMGSTVLNKPVTSITAAADGSGYWLVGLDGGIFSFGVDFHGSLPGVDPTLTGVRIRAVEDGSSYLILSPNGLVYQFKDGQVANVFEAPLAAGEVAVDLLLVPSS
jgi:hypothetical protein